MGDAGEPGAGTLDPDAVTFALAHPGLRCSAVRLHSGLSLAPDRRELRRSGTTWTLRLPRPAVDRLEYEFAVEYADGRSEQIRDPANPERVDGEFGERSVRLLGGYRAPAWLGE